MPDHLNVGMPSPPTPDDYSGDGVESPESRSMRRSHTNDRPLTLKEQDSRARTWMCRCYAVTAPAPTATTLRCVNLLWPIAPDLPKTFTWGDRADVIGLKRYIDALVVRDSMVAAHYERKHLVSEVEVASPLGEEHRVTVPLEQFVDFVLLRGSFSMPLWGKVAFIRGRGSTRFVPAEFIPAVKALAEHVRRSEGIPAFDLDDSWSEKLTDTQLLTHGASPDEMTTTLYGRAAAPTAPDDGAGGASEAPDVPPAEVEVTRSIGDRVACVLSLVRATNPFYVLRYLDLRHPRWVWVGTAWSPGGPWSVQERDNAALLALGVSTPA